MARTPALLDEARKVAPLLAARMAPNTPEDIVTQIGRLKSVYGLGDRTEGEWEALGEAYIEALEPIPAECLAHAIVVWNRTGDRFPLPGQIYKLAKEEQTKLQLAAWRARKASEYRDHHRPPPSAEERAKVKAMLDELRGPDGAVRFGGAEPKTIPPAPRPTYRTPAQMAEDLRRAADEEEPI